MLKDGKHALSLMDQKICLVEVDTSKVLGTLEEENEDVITFTVSANQKILVTATKNYMVKAYRMPEIPEDTDSKEVWKPENFHTFRMTGALALELSIDPSSRYVAAGTTTSEVKVYDLQKGFQTHNFMGHRGVLVKLAFIPHEGSLQLISAAEDMLVKVWDLVLNTEICTIKMPTPSAGRATCFAFSKDFKTVMIGYRDGSITFLNTQKEFSLLHIIKCDTKLGFETDEEEIHAMVYMTFGGQTSYLAVGSQTGKIVVLDLATMEPCFHEVDHVSSETIFLAYRKSEENACGQLISVNMDQNMFIYDIKEEKLAKGSLNKKISLTKSGSLCLFLDEVIDVKFISESSKFALLCSNSETIKLLNMESRQIELYQGHTEIVLCLDIVSKNEAEERAIFLSGAKDNTIKLWDFNGTMPFQQRIKCTATFSGHNENISGVCFAPKKHNFFASVSQDNTLKVWNVLADEPESAG